MHPLKFLSVTTEKEAERATVHEGFWQPFLESRKQEPGGVYSAVCMQIICGDENEYKSLCITLNHEVYEGEKLFSLPTAEEKTTQSY